MDSDQTVSVRIEPEREKVHSYEYFGINMDSVRQRQLQPQNTEIT